MTSSTAAPYSISKSKVNLCRGELARDIWRIASKLAPTVCCFTIEIEVELLTYLDKCLPYQFLRKI
jgi:hypothetical protein